MIKNVYKNLYTSPLKTSHFIIISLQLNRHLDCCHHFQLSILLDLVLNIKQNKPIFSILHQTRHILLSFLFSEFSILIVSA